MGFGVGMEKVWTSSLVILHTSILLQEGPGQPDEAAGRYDRLPSIHPSSFVALITISFSGW